MKLKINEGIQLVKRRAREEDYRFCYSLTRRNMILYYKKYDLEWKPKSFKKNFKLNSVKILEHNKKRIGFYKLIFKEGSYYLGDLQLSNSARNKGIGTAVMKSIEKEIISKKYHVINLRVFISNPAISFYKKLGYRKLKREGNIYLMTKRLK